MNELALRGDVLLVGSGGSCFLRDHPIAFHIRLVAPMTTRLRRVMEYRWYAEASARKLIAESDRQPLAASTGTTSRPTGPIRWSTT